MFVGTNIFTLEATDATEAQNKGSASPVNLVNGSLASIVVVLLSFEVDALILLFGAQVIAEFERCQPDDDPNRFQT